jgi:triacylglycerol esterase/lipase EstA (alpha/beta hydrolase family)
MVCVTFALANWIFRGVSSRNTTETPVGRGTGMFLAVFAEWLATVMVGYCIPLRALRRGPPRLAVPAGRCPVALLPGYMENVASMALLERRLERLLGVPVRTLTPRRYFTSLENLAADYRLQIEAFLKATGAKRVDLAGHSMGGLLVRYLVEEGGLAAKVRTVVSIAAPHQGSALAPLAPGRNLRQMRRGSGFLEKLNAGAPPASVRFVSICSTHDNLVVPWNCALSPHGDNFILRYRGHITLIMSGEVARKIAGELDRRE